MQTKLIKEIEKAARTYFPPQGHHGFDHTLRVRRLAMQIGKAEAADLQIVEAAALLHDIAREKEDKGEIECHAAHGAVEAEKILENVSFPKEKIAAVQHCIAVHRASKHMKAETIEAKILQDADRLDLLGAIGIGRYFHRAGAMGREMYNPEQSTNVEYRGQQLAAVNNLIVKGVNFTKPENFNTKTAQKMAKGRHGFLKEFVERFIAEWKGEK
ncbi:MAG: HD domain-containing protein [Candidatus Diapherotrites archaeon]|nr:HD domain-containing protein [Candidatus Diapherotrites archaeon]